MCKKKKGLNLLIKLVNLIKKNIKKTGHKTLSEEQKCMVILFSDIVHLTDNCLAIFNDGDVIPGIPILIRSFFERCIDLFILHKNANHFNNIKLYAHIESKKYLLELQLAKKRDAEFQTGIENIDQLITEHLEKIAEYQSRSFKEISFIEKLEILEEFYGEDFRRIYVYYRKLSGMSHNNLHQMILKYMYKDQDDSEWPLVIEPIYKEDEYLVYLNFIAKIILYSFNELMDEISETELVTDEMIKISDAIKALQTS